MLISKSKRDMNQSAKAATKFMAEQGTPLAHAQSLTLVARMMGFPNSMAAQAVGY